MVGRPAKDIMTLTDGGEYTVMKDLANDVSVYTSNTKIISKQTVKCNLQFVYSQRTESDAARIYHLDRNVAEEKGFKPVGLYVNGERKTMYLSDTAVEQVLNLGSANTTRDKFVSTVSGANLY